MAVLRQVLDQAVQRRAVVAEGAADAAAGRVARLGGAGQRLGRPLGHAQRVHVLDAGRQVVQLVEPDRALPGVQRLQVAERLAGGRQLQVRGRALLGEGVVVAGAGGQGRAGQRHAAADHDEHRRRHRRHQSRVDPLRRRRLAGLDEVDGQPPRLRLRQQQAGGARERPPVAGREHVARGAAERVEGVDGQVQRVGKPPRQGAVGAARDVDGLHARRRGVAREDGEVAADLRGQAGARRERAGQEDAAAADDAELGPPLARGHHRRGHVGRHHGGRRGRGQAERPRRQPGELEARGLAQPLVGGEEVASQHQHHRPPLAAVLADRGVVEDDFVGRVRQLLEGLEADDGGLFRLGDGGVADLLEHDPVAADAGQHGRRHDAGFFEALAQEAAQLLGAGGVGGALLAPEGGAAEGDGPAADVAGDDVELLPVPVEREEACQLFPSVRPPVIWSW